MLPVSLVITVLLLWHCVDSVDNFGDKLRDERISGGKRVTIVTASDGGKYFKRLRNFVGSVHFWEPELSIKVYDLGLSAEQQQEVAGWMNVELREFPFDQWPAHVRDLRRFAWKPLVMRDALARDSPILYQDAGQELRREIAEIEQLILRDDHFFVVQEGMKTLLKCCGPIGELTQQQTIEQMIALSENNYQLTEPQLQSLKSDTMCAGGIQGYIRNGLGHRLVLDPVVACALQESCINPPGADQSNHRFDQSLFSIRLHRLRQKQQLGNEEGDDKALFQCHKEPRFWANRGNNGQAGARQGITDDPTEKGSTILFSRRGWGIDYDVERTGGPPYVKFLKTIKTEL